MIAPFIAQVSFLSWLLHPGVPLPHIPAWVLQVLMSQSVIQALTPFAVASLICALGTFLLPIETKGRALLVRNLLMLLLKTVLQLYHQTYFISFLAKLLMTAAAPSFTWWIRHLQLTSVILLESLTVGY